MIRHYVLGYLPKLPILPLLAICKSRQTIRVVNQALKTVKFNLYAEMMYSFP